MTSSVKKKLRSYVKDGKTYYLKAGENPPSGVKVEERYVPVAEYKQLAGTSMAGTEAKTTRLGDQAPAVGQIPYVGGILGNAQIWGGGGDDDHNRNEYLKQSKQEVPYYEVNGQKRYLRPGEEAPPGVTLQTEVMPLERAQREYTNIDRAYPQHPLTIERQKSSANAAFTNGPQSGNPMANDPYQVASQHVLGNLGQGEDFQVNNPYLDPNRQPIPGYGVYAGQGAGPAAPPVPGAFPGASVLPAGTNVGASGGMTFSPGLGRVPGHPSQGQFTAPGPRPQGGPGPGNYTLADPGMLRDAASVQGEALTSSRGITAADTERQRALSQLDQYAQDINLLRRSAMGEGPSAAERMHRSALDSNQRGMASMAATARGGNIASALRSATAAGSNANLQATNQLAALRANEQLTAQGQLAGAQAQHAGAIDTTRRTDVTTADLQAKALQAAANGTVGLADAETRRLGVGGDLALRGALGGADIQERARLRALQAAGMFQEPGNIALRGQWGVNQAGASRPDIWEQIAVAGASGVLNGVGSYVGSWLGDQGKPTQSPTTTGPLTNNAGPTSSFNADPFGGIGR